MKKTSKQANISLRPQQKKLITIVAIILIGGLLIKGVTNLGQPAGVNLIEESSGITLEGTLFKDAPVGVPGSYYLVNMTGNVIRLQTTENLDSFEGTLVRVQGNILPQQDNNSPQTIAITQLELLSTQ